MMFPNRNRSCHAEPIRSAQGKLREASLCSSRQALRFAQGDIGKNSRRAACTSQNSLATFIAVPTLTYL